MLTHFYVVNVPVGFKYKIYFILCNILLIPFLHIHLHPINISKIFFLLFFIHIPSFYLQRKRKVFGSHFANSSFSNKIDIVYSRVFFGIVSGLRNIVHVTLYIHLENWYF